MLVWAVLRSKTTYEQEKSQAEISRQLVPLCGHQQPTSVRAI